MPVQAADTSTTGNSQELQPVIIQATAIAGAAIDADKIPGNVQTLSAADLTRNGTANLTGRWTTRLGSVNINDTLDDPFQPTSSYRGFEASPVLGTPQGSRSTRTGCASTRPLATRSIGTCFPNIAIKRVDLISSSPVYGLNALGGGISISMKDGFSYHGSDVELSGGSFGNHAAAVQYGAKFRTISASTWPATHCKTAAGARTPMIRCASYTPWRALAPIATSST
jgi:iron complex outermembrane receptor protein